MCFNVRLATFTLTNLARSQCLGTGMTRKEHWNDIIGGYSDDKKRSAGMTPFSVS
ncbi:hypothetical protein [Wolbachia endosymbiont (group B) of Limnophora tigrina]|uniref:hypothetical protein n=1 Tax=Wolbachia endosymbiont (group B) of Limnophora tigrina TaxID=3139317 RepID=UPI0035B5381C